jgi:hypothetical protein
VVIEIIRTHGVYNEEVVRVYFLFYYALQGKVISIKKCSTKIISINFEGFKLFKPVPNGTIFVEVLYGKSTNKK